MINGPNELTLVAQKADVVLISQGFDDHAHTPTLKRLAATFPLMQYICPPSAKPILESNGIKANCIRLLKPGIKTTMNMYDA